MGGRFSLRNQGIVVASGCGCLGRKLTLFLLDKLARMLDCIIDICAEVLFANQLDKASATHGFHGLFVCVAEDQFHAVLGAVVVEVL